MTQTTGIVWLDWLVAGLLVGGGVFSCAAGLGMLRLGDVFLRAHAQSKAGTLGVGLIVAAVALVHADFSVTLRAAAVILFLMVTTPVAAHLIGRAAYRSGVRLSSLTRRDDLARDRRRDGMS